MNTIKINLTKNVNLKFLSEEEIEAFTDIDIYLEYEDKTIKIFNNDYLKEALDRINGSFLDVLNGKYKFPENLDFNKGIYYYNELFLMSIDENSKYINIDFPKHDPTDKVSWLLSTNKGYQTFLYSYKDYIYLEVVKAFEPKFDENENIDINCFNDWLKDYSIDYRITISKPETETFLKNLKINFNSVI